MKKPFILLLTLLGSLSFATAQTHDSIKVKRADTSEAKTIVQEMPKFLNGSLNDYLSSNIKYPETEKKKGITGIVYVTFVVEKDGSISGVRVLRGVPNGPNLDAEAVRVISSMPKWQPGMQDGKPVRVQFNIPIHFTLI
jgi:TonB family protein